MNDPIYDESGYQIGEASPLKTPEIKVVYGDGKEPVENFSYEIGMIALQNIKNSAYKYAEDRIISDFFDYVNKTYDEHYKTDTNNIQCFDAWIALGDATPTFRNTAMKYLWRYGKKNGNNKDDLMKVLHYTLMCLYVDHYKDSNNGN